MLHNVGLRLRERLWQSQRSNVYSMYSECMYMSVKCYMGFCQGGPGIANNDWGSIFFEMTPGLGLPRYVSGRLSIYSNAPSILV